MKSKKILSLFLIALGLFLFYWFQIRPTEIRNYCDQVAWQTAENKFYDQYWKTWHSEIDQETYDWKYTQCLHSQGLK